MIFQASAAAADRLPVWPETMQPAEGPQPQPIAPVVLADARLQSFGAQRSLEEASQDASQFQVAGQGLKRRDGCNSHAFGCGAEHHNVCHARLSREGIISGFGRLQASWNKWARTIPKTEASSGDVVVLIQPSGRKDIGLWVLLAEVVFSPLVQTCLVCAPVGRIGTLPRADAVCAIQARDRDEPLAPLPIRPGRLPRGPAHDLRRVVARHGGRRRS